MCSNNSIGFSINYLESITIVCSCLFNCKQSSIQSDNISATASANRSDSFISHPFRTIIMIKVSVRAMTHEVTDRHTAHALRRCATTPKESLSAPRERGDVRSADTLSVNPGLRPGQSNQRSMHRNAVPLRHKLVFAFWIKPAAPRKNRSKLHFSLGLRGFSLGLH